MLHRMVALGSVALLATALGSATAYAQDEDPLAEPVEVPADDGMGDPMDDGGMAGEAGTGETGMEGDMAGGETMGEEHGSGAHGPTLPKGSISLMVALQANLTTDQAFKPFSIAPDVWYGATDKLSVGLVHSYVGITGFWSGLAGTGLCLAGDENGCAEVYDNVGAEALFSLMGDGPLHLAAHGGVHLLSFSDPTLASLKLGVKGAYHTGKIAIMFAPNVFVAVTERDFNDDFINVPVGVSFMVNQQLALGAQTGISGPRDGFGDFYRIPLSFGGIYHINQQLMAGASFSLDRVAGFEGPGAADLRSLVIFAGYRM